MATNEILQFAATSPNILTQPAYLADPQRPLGHQPGIARATLANKAALQSSLMSAALAQFIADKQANNITDSLTPAQIAGYLADAIESGAQNVAVAGGTANALTAAYVPVKLSVMNGETFLIRAGLASTTTTPTLAVDALAAKLIVKGANGALALGDIAGAGHWLELQYDSVLDRFVLQNPAKGIDVVVVTQPAQLQNVTATCAGNNLTINYAGGTLDFRSATLNNGVPISGVVVPPLSIVVPNTALMGATSGVSQRIYIEVAYNGGSPVLCASGINELNLDETTLISPTTISVASDAGNVIYSALAVAANSPFRVVGFLDISQAVAGVWVTQPTRVQPVGGQAVNNLGSIGFGQNWQAVVRVVGTTYYNSTGRAIQIKPTVSSTGSGGLIITVNGVNKGYVCHAFSGSGAQYGVGHMIIPDGASYSVATATTSGVTSIFEWFELR